MKPNKHRVVVLAALPLTAVLAGGAAFAATGPRSATSPTGTVAAAQTQQRSTDRAHDGTCRDRSTTATPTCLQDRSRDRDRDGTGMRSPSAVPGAVMLHHAYGTCFGSGEADGQ